MHSRANPTGDGVPQKLEAETERKQAREAAAAALAAGSAGVVDGAGEKGNSHSRKDGYHGKLGAHFGHRGQKEAETKDKQPVQPSSKAKATQSKLPRNFPAPLQKKLPKQPAYEAKIATGITKVARAQAKVRVQHAPAHTLSTLRLHPPARSSSHSQRTRLAWVRA